MFKIYRSLSAFIFVFSALSLQSGCLKKQELPPVAQKPHVSVAEAISKTYVERFDFPGRIDAVDSITLKTRVDGFLKERLFEEGEVVKKGQLLFIIEKAPFEAKVAQATANLAKAHADAKIALLNLNRAIELQKTGNISTATVDARQADNSVAKAQVLQMQAQLNLATIDLGYTNVKAPFTGKIGLAAYSVGEYLSANTTLATLVSFDPMNVIFSVSEQELLALQKDGVFKENAGLSISLQMADSSIYRYSGHINFMDVIVSQETDTLKLRAGFPNPSQQLVAGQFVNVLLEYESLVERFQIPQASLMSSTTGKYVYVVNAQNIVVNTPIKVGPVQGKDIVVFDGLQKGDRVIFEGLQKVRPGIEVIVDTPSIEIQKTAVSSQASEQKPPLAKRTKPSTPSEPADSKKITRKK